MNHALSVYVHVPFCARRCGYCDFNTYTASELGSGASQSGFASLVQREIGLAAQSLERSETPVSRVPSVFFGGGTPTLLPAIDLAVILESVKETWGIQTGAEITTEANPDSLSQSYIDDLAAAGFNRISLGMQSAVPHVLKTLDRTHNPEQVGRAVTWAQAAGMRVSLDVIYGTPGESLADWRNTIEAVLATGVDHVSAYALKVEPHTKMGRAISRGEMPAPSDDDEADKYELADQLFIDAGLEWYEISNWARGGINGPNASQHNLAYWRGTNWWGFGPGAHSHVADRRFWNVAHPAKYATALAGDELPIADSETLSPENRELENVMLSIRLSDGLKISSLPVAARSKVAKLVADGLVDGQSAIIDKLLKLTIKGRLLADTVTQMLV
jgi:oxygen-independent coproporphyrinogen-3 oxidase